MDEADHSVDDHDVECHSLDLLDSIDFNEGLVVDNVRAEDHEADGPHETEKFGEDDAPGTIVSFNKLIAVLECETVPNDTRERG